jgi:hypothetical protein
MADAGAIWRRLMKRTIRITTADAALFLSGIPNAACNDQAFQRQQLVIDVDNN